MKLFMDKRAVFPLRPKPSVGSMLAAWFLVHLLINGNYPTPFASFLDLLRPSLEAWALLLLLSFLAALKVPFTPRVYVPLILAWLFVRFFRLADALVPLYLSRPFNFYMDLRFLPDLFHLLSHSFGRTLWLFYIGVTVLLLFGILWGLYKAFFVAWRAFAVPRYRRFFWGLTAAQALLILLYFYAGNPFHSALPVTVSLPRMIQEAHFILQIREIERKGLSAVHMAGAQVPRMAAPLDRLKRRDVYLFFVESYGQILFTDPRYNEAFIPAVKRMTAALQASGYDACSSFLHSPTFGGESWLAFGTVESGVWLNDQLRYNLLLNSAAPTLAGYFNQAHYRTISVMPGTTRPWPEGKYFRYGRQYEAKDFDYRGPSFGWSPMPDQFVLDRIFAQEIARRSEPLFIRYVLTSSHASFNRQPPYLEQWEQIGQGQIYHQLAPVTFAVNWPDLTHAGPAYMTAIIYDLTVLQGYLTGFIKDDALIIVAGDHQPNGQLTGPGASYLVPVHVLSRAGDLLAPFLKSGYTPGLVPDGPPPYKRMDTFMADFLTAFSSPATTQRPFHMTSQPAVE